MPVLHFRLVCFFGELSIEGLEPGNLGCVTARVRWPLCGAILSSNLSRSCKPAMQLKGKRPEKLAGGGTPRHSRPACDGSINPRHVERKKRREDDRARNMVRLAQELERTKIEEY
jgi:hypothetical protein